MVGSAARRVARVKTSVVAINMDFVQCFFYDWVTRTKPLLQKVDTQHDLYG